MRRVLIILASIAAILLIGFFVLRTLTKSSSPESVTQFSNNGLTATIDYCRPYKKGRAIFGGLVPYGKVWRTGANEATIVRFDQDVVIAGKPLKAGSYSLWTIPEQEKWTAIFNGETGQWGTNYDQTKDVLRVPVEARPRKPAADQFLIDFVKQPAGMDMQLIWDETEVIIPIRKP